jgi:hypothetical protein
MTVPCPDPEELARLLDGELTENRGAALRAHLATCARCAAEHRAQSHLVARLGAPVPGVPSVGALAAVMGRLDAADAEARRPRPSALPRLRAALAALAAAAAVVLVVGAPGGRRGDFAARGAAVPWEQKVGVELWALEGAPRRLAAGDRIAPGTPVVASYSNVDDAPAWLLAFAVDARGEVHWLYPAFLDATRDPEALRLDPAAVQRALPESVVLEEVPDGALRVITLVTRERRHVSEIEGAPPADRTPEALRRRWPGARIDELSVCYGRTAGAPAACGARP